MAFLSASALFQCSLLLDSTQKKTNWYFICSFQLKCPEKVFVVWGFSSLLLFPSVFCLLGIFQAVPLALTLSYFSSSFLRFILPFQRSNQVKASSNLTPACEAEVSAKAEHQEEQLSREKSGGY